MNVDIVSLITMLVKSPRTFVVMYLLGRFKSLTVGEIIKIYRSNHRSVYTSINALKKLGLLDIVKAGGVSPSLLLTEKGRYVADEIVRVTGKPSVDLVRYLEENGVHVNQGMLRNILYIEDVLRRSGLLDRESGG